MSFSRLLLVAANSKKCIVGEGNDKECGSLPEECRSDCHKQIAQIIWKACLYQNGASQDAIVDFQQEVRKHGFSDIGSLDRADNDLRPLLSGDGRSAKEMARKFQKHRKR